MKLLFAIFLPIVASLDCTNPSETVTVKTSTQAANAASKVSCDNGDFTIKWEGDIEAGYSFDIGENTKVSFIGSGVDESIIRVDGTSLFSDSFTPAGISIKDMTISESGNSAIHYPITMDNVVLDGFLDHWMIWFTTLDAKNIVCKNSNECLYLYKTTGNIKEPLFTGNTGLPLIFSSSNVTMENPVFQFNDVPFEKAAFDMFMYESEVIIHGDAVFEGGRGLSSFTLESDSRLEFKGNTRINNNVGNQFELKFQLFSPGNVTYYYGVSTVRESSISFQSLDVHDNYNFTRGFLVDMGTMYVNGDASFYNNNSTWSGGALQALNSRIYFTDDTTFRENFSNHSSGAMDLFASDVLFTEDAYFLNNSARLDGGSSGLATDSSLYFSRNAVFEDNSGESGGAISSRSSAINFRGGATFNNNNALGKGGVMYVTETSLDFSGDIYFENNTAVLDGGAIYSWTSLDDSSVISFLGNSVFSKNNAGGSGGAVYIRGSDVTILDTLFYNNSAGVSGGATEFINIVDGQYLLNCTFENNYAPAGGAVHELACGSSRNSATNVDYVNCSFYGNNAYTGGAFHTTSGITNVVGSDFTDNVAEFAGAIRSEGVVTIQDSLFEDNAAGEGNGPVVLNTGTIYLERTDFASNTVNCKVDEYKDTSDGDRYGEVCSSCSPCTNCTIEDPKRVPTCYPVPENTRSAGGGSTIQDISIDPGFWRSMSIGEIIVECHNGDACTGGQGLGSCDEGYEGVYCATCSEGYSMSPGFVCTKCGDWGDAVVAIIVILLILFMSTCIMYLLRGLPCVGNKRVKFYSLKIIVVVWQIVSQFSFVTNTTYPGVYEYFLDIVGSLGFNLDWLMSLSCTIDTDFHDRLLLVTICPIVLSLLPLITHRLSERTEDSIRRHVSFLLAITFFVFSPVSTTLFQMFACETLEDGREFLRADYSIECTSNKHRTLQGYSFFMMVVYTLGIPVVYLYLLYKNRSERDEDNVASSLWNSYRPSAHYFEIVEFLRRIMMTGIIVFIYPDSASQVAITLVFAITFIVISMAVKPYINRNYHVLSVTGHIIVFFTVYIALLYKVDVSDENDESQDIFASFIVAVHLLLIASVGVEAYFSIREVREAIAPCRNTSV